MVGTLPDVISLGLQVNQGVYKDTVLLRMLELQATCRQLYSIKHKLTNSLTLPPYTAGYVQQLIHLAIDILENLPETAVVPANEKARVLKGLQTAKVLADKYDEVNGRLVPLYEMADVLQPALVALDRFLLICHYPAEES